MALSMTASGLGFDPLDPNPDSIIIEDIAHALSNICRYGGHTGEFYSVAQHSVLVSICTDAKFARAALMHDASEAYIGDVIRPVKRRLGLAYSVVEDMVMTAIAKKFGFEYPLPPEVKAADELVGSTEWRDIMHHRPEWNLCGTEEVMEAEIKPLLPKAAEKEFLLRFDELFGQLQFDYSEQLRKALIGRDEAMSKPIDACFICHRTWIAPDDGKFLSHGKWAHISCKDRLQKENKSTWVSPVTVPETPKSSSSGKRRPSTKSKKASRSSATQAKNSTSSSKRRGSTARKPTSRTPRSSR